MELSYWLSQFLLGLFIHRPRLHWYRRPMMSTCSKNLYEVINSRQLRLYHTHQCAIQTILSLEEASSVTRNAVIVY